MFVLHELEKLLHDFVTNQRYSSTNQRPTSISLADINLFSVNQLQLSDKVQLQPINIGRELQLDAGDEMMKCFDFAANQLSTDLVFANQMRTIVLNRLIQMPQRAFPSARVMICDQKSYELMAKFQYITQRLAPHNDSECRFFIYKQPFNITAILLLEDIVDTLDSLKRPFVTIKRDQDGKQGASYDYSIIRQVFPYLRITDLAIVLDEIGTLRLKTHTSDGKKEHQVLQFLTHFARSTQLIELQSIRKLIGRQHPIYDNVSIFQSHLLNNDATTTKSADQQQQQQQQKQLQQLLQQQQNVKKLVAANGHLTPKLAHLTKIASRLISLVQHLGWSLESITFRSGDPTGFTKIFSQILDSSLKYKTKANKSQGAASQAKNISITPVRLLVLDRFVDLQGLLRHSDRYGSFIEQEMESPLAKTKTGQIDCLLRRLCFDKLTDVLGSILRLSVDIKPSDMVGGQPRPLESKQQQQQRRFNNNNNSSNNNVKFSTLSTNQALHKHLDIIKSMYRTLNEGYLLLLKLESNIDTILDSLRNLSAPLDDRDQNEIAERLRRIGTAFKQLVDVNSASIKVSDAIRFAYRLIDAISVFLFLHPNAQAAESLIDLKTVFVFDKEFRQSLRAVIELHGNDLHGNNYNETDEEAAAATGASCGQSARRGAWKRVDIDAELMEKLDNFDAISSEMCANRSLLTLEEIVECFYKRQLDSLSHPCLKLGSTVSGLIKSGSKSKIIVLLLGSITYDELNRLKALETRLMRAKYLRSGKNVDESHSQSDILTMACNLIGPKDFLKSL